MSNHRNLNMGWWDHINFRVFSMCLTKCLLPFIDSRLNWIGFNQRKSTWTSYYLKAFTTINFPLSRIFLLLVCYIKCSTTNNFSQWGNKGSNLIISNYSQIAILVNQHGAHLNQKLIFQESPRKLKDRQKSNYIIKEIINSMVTNRCSLLQERFTNLV